MGREEFMGGWLDGVSEKDCVSSCRTCFKLAFLGGPLALSSWANGPYIGNLPPELAPPPCNGLVGNVGKGGIPISLQKPFFYLSQPPSPRPLASLLFNRVHPQAHPLLPPPKTLHLDYPIETLSIFANFKRGTAPKGLLLK